ncbi:MAG TPA: ester cyclase [Rugosimonospora sp.]|nr:ester cyclase [Rugosimonospora sp.]
MARQIMTAWNDHGETHLPQHLAHPQMMRHFPHPVGLAAAAGGPPPEPALPRSAIHGQHFHEDMIIANHQYALIAWQMTGQHKGSLYGRAATGAPVTVYGADLIRLADGQVIEHWTWHSKSRLQALGQLGLLDDKMQNHLVSNNLLGRNRRLV